MKNVSLSALILMAASVVSSSLHRNFYDHDVMVETLKADRTK